MDRDHSIVTVMRRSSELDRACSPFLINSSGSNLPLSLNAGTGQSKTNIIPNLSINTGININLLTQYPQHYQT